MSYAKLKVILTVIFIYFFLKYCFSFLSPFICGFALAKLISKSKSSVLIYVLILLTLSAIILFLILLFYFQIKNFYFDLPRLSEALISYLKNQPLLIEQLHEPLISLMKQLLGFFSSALILLPKAFSFLFLTMLLTFLFLLDIHAPGRILLSLFPFAFDKAQKAEALLFQTFFSMMISSFKLFLITWVECLAGLLLLKIDQALLFSFITACFDSMPLMGVGFILLPYAVYLFIIQSTKAIGILLLYALITLLRFFIEPKILSHQLNIPFLLHLFMMLLCARLFGWIGFLYSPILCVLILVWYKQKSSE